MRTKLLASALLAASLIAAPAVAFAAHSDATTPETKSEATTPKQPMRHAMRHQHHFTNQMWKNHHMSKGTTTGMASSHKGSPPAAQKSDKSTY